MVGELRWGSVLRGVWEGILIQHATHDVGPTMTAPIPALIFHRFYSRPSPSPLVQPVESSRLASRSLGPPPPSPRLTLSRSRSLSVSGATVASPGYPASPPEASTIALPRHGTVVPATTAQPDILYRETCLSLQPAPLNKQLSK